MKRIVITLALALLPITAIQPAEAGVFSCGKTQTFYKNSKRVTYSQYTYKKTCTYKKYGR